ncbi:MAG: restriction endonuclease subunit S [Desulfobacterales bacterium]|uniref:Restriction endonuclease subunit S n=1 Tax=Candidatus Desulfaltia bathyphila TaxID=2841697 RepID=A0A8J6N6C8_9BACT|nr:restriction endonuclease subunit S [Candidatus Desulfaltia bathyphila]MBL7194880.1 restriction endonuclease subunit S [Desulfobacterales bacterium]MBL7206922.1 restriction endonuclease subunit S [Desulfobacterales bacterium]
MKNCSSDWKNKPFPECIKPVRFKRSKQIQTNFYLPSGDFPIIDQGQSKIAGWTNDKSTVINDNLPLIVFGDHTRVFKFIDFPFAIGADGTKLIKPRGDRFCSRYFYYYLQNLNLPSKGYSRHFKLLKETEISYPEIPEQQKIAAVLLKIQQAIEVQESIIEAAQELKKSTMQRVFTYGLRGEKTKETEIGRVPERWDKGKLDDLCSLQTTSCIPSQTDKDIYIGLEHIKSGSFVIKRYGLPKDVKSSKTIFKKGDLLYGKLRPYLDKAVISDENGICSTDILVLRSYNDRYSWFILGLLHLDRFIHHAVQTTHGVNHPRTSWKAIRDYHIGIPEPNEIERIGNILRKIEDKLTLNESKKSALQDLFKIMLNKLMTGEIRVKESDIDTSCVLEMKNRG